MFKEIEKLKTQLDRATLSDETLVKEWQIHPVTKAFTAEIKYKLLEAILDIEDCPTTEQSLINHASNYGRRDALKSLLNSDWFEVSDEE